MFYQGLSLTMIGMPLQQRPGAVQLLDQHHPYETMRQGHLAEGDPVPGLLQQIRRQPVGPAGSVRWSTSSA